MAGDQSNLEMQPLQHGQGQDQSAKRHYWDRVFQTLAEADGDEVDHAKIGGVPTIHIRNLKAFLKNEKSLKLELETSLPRYQLMHLVKTLPKSDANKDGLIDEHEWRQHVNKYSREFMDSGVAGGALRVVLYTPTFSCNPPTLFLILITALQIVFYFMSIYAPETLGIEEEFGDPRWPISSFFIYDPYKRIEAWRFVTYMFLHGGHQHIAFNCIMQLLVGIPLEMSQMGWTGMLRVAGLYLAGVGMGCLGASVAEPSKYLLGASAGVYALIFAHLATLVLNWKEDGMVYDERMKKNSENQDEKKPSLSLNRFIRAFRLAFIVLFTLVDVGTILYNVINDGQSTTSYAGHAFGGLAGVLVGTILLENRKVDDWERYYKWIAFGVYWAAMFTFVLWHIIGSFVEPIYFPEQKA